MQEPSHHRRSFLRSLTAATATLALPATLTACGQGAAPAPPPGVQIAPDPPLQQNIPPLVLKDEDGEVITGLASFDITARVLSTKRYRWDSSARYSPLDIAFGWGPMSDTAVIEKLSIGQHWRFGYVSWRGAPPVAEHQIFDNFANCHIVPATGNSRNIMLGVRPNELLRLGGYLIRIEREDGWRWQSSLSRRDNGPGACELIYVIDAAVMPA